MECPLVITPRGSGGTVSADVGMDERQHLTEGDVVALPRRRTALGVRAIVQDHGLPAGIHVRSAPLPSWFLTQESLEPAPADEPLVPLLARLGAEMLASNDAVTRQECVRAVVLSGGHGHVCFAQSLSSFTLLRRGHRATHGWPSAPATTVHGDEATGSSPGRPGPGTPETPPCAAQEVPLALGRIGIDQRLTGCDRWLRVALPGPQSRSAPSARSACSGKVRGARVARAPTRSHPLNMMSVTAATGRPVHPMRRRRARGAVAVRARQQLCTDPQEGSTGRSWSASTC